MKNKKWVKGFGRAILFLFIGSIILPNINANLINKSIFDSTPNNSTENTTVVLIGLNKDKIAYTNGYEFTCILVVCTQRFPDGDIEINKLINLSVYFEYYTKIGVVCNHIICALFIISMPEIKEVGL